MNLEKNSSQLPLFEVEELNPLSELAIEARIMEAGEEIIPTGSLYQDSVIDSHDHHHCNQHCHQHCHHHDHQHSEGIPFNDDIFFNTPGAKWSQPGGRGNPVNITYSFNDFGNFNGISAEEAELALEEAFALWASVAPLNFTEVEDNSGNSQIRISQDAIDGRGGTLAFAFFPSNGDITFDSGENWTPGTFLETAVHEIGHSLGLAHEDGVDAILNSSLRGRYSGLGSSFLLPDDIAGVQNLYGSGVGTVNALEDDFSTSEIAEGINATEGDDILIGDSEVNQIAGLGGNDFIEGGFGLDIIDGNEGIDTVSYSYNLTGITWDMNTDQLFFQDGSAETVRNVENVVASQGNDRITGNSENNTITGGNGADVFVFSSLDGSTDIIRDYTIAQGDRIEVVSAGFGAGEVNYDANSGGLFFEEQQFAILENRPDFDSVLSGLVVT